MYDLIIIGSGCAGLGAAVYARRFEMQTLVIGDLPGGTITKTHLVENYPGFVSLSGLELGNKLLEHAKALQAEFQQTSAEKITPISPPSEGGRSTGFQVTAGGQIYEAKAIIIATGTEHRNLNVLGEAEFTNKGVSYCATCDSPFFKGKTVAIVGGSDSAVKESLIAAEHAAKVYIIYRKDKLRAEPINLRRMEAKDNIEVIYSANITEIYGEGVVKGVKLDTGKDLPLDGVFVEIGRLPRSELAKDLGVELAENGEIKIDRVGRTNVPGVFGAGDVTDTAWKQAITGVAEGAHAANQVFEFISR
jgi:thioredoxin reductase (NADPH)